MGAGNPRAAQYDHLAPEDLNPEGVTVLGRQIWRVVPYGLRYRNRAIVGILSNGMARFADIGNPTVAHLVRNARWLMSASCMANLRLQRG